MLVKEFTLANLSEEEKSKLQEMEKALHSQDYNETQHSPKLVMPSGETFQIPNQTLQAIQQMMEHMIKGKAYSVTPYNCLLSINEATEYLGTASNKFVSQLLETDQLPYVRVGQQRFIQFGDLLEYEKRVHRERLELLDEMLEFSQETGTL